MRNKQHLVKEIVEANAIKLAYNYYLATNVAGHEVENTTQILLNLKTVNVTLRRLYLEFEDLNKKRLKDERREMVDRKVSSGQWSCTTDDNYKPRTLNSKQQTSLQTAKAIMLFNADARFSITE